MVSVKSMHHWGREKARERYASGGDVPPIQIKPSTPDSYIRDKEGRPTAIDADVVYTRAGINPATGEPLKKGK